MEELDHVLIYPLIGRGTFLEIVEYFYEMVSLDELLLPMYPKDLTMAKKKLSLFLIQKFGGPDDYRPLRGNPMMRRRHMEFTIGIKERNRWISIMEAALDKAGIVEVHKARYTLQKYFERMASHMINQSDIQFA